MWPLSQAGDILASNHKEGGVGHSRGTAWHTHNSQLSHGPRLHAGFPLGCSCPFHETHLTQAQEGDQQ